MNKYEEAFHVVSMGDSFPGAEEQFEKGLEVLRELVEKETPKKPRPVFLPMAYIPHKCPVCWSPVNYRKEKFNYCPKCGQRIDWNEEE